MKSAPLPPCQVPQVRQARQAPYRYVRWGLPLAAAVLILLVWPIPLPSWKVVEPLDVPVTWDEIVPSQELKYHNCGDEFQCARLEVPMDYQRTDGKGRTFALAVVRLPAKVPVTDPRYGGAVLINPGEWICTRYDDLSSYHRWTWWTGNNASVRGGSRSSVDHRCGG